jgi:hypothetical protein
MDAMLSPPVLMCRVAENTGVIAARSLFGHIGRSKLIIRCSGAFENSQLFSASAESGDAIE